MGSRTDKNLITACVVALIGTYVSGCSLAGALSDDEHQIAWNVAARPEGRVVRIVSEVGHCVGRPEPRFEDVEVDYEGERAYIVATLDRPEVELDDDELCAGIGLFVYGKVKLKQDVDDLILYDASVYPPEQRWPIE